MYVWNLCLLALLVKYPATYLWIILYANIKQANSPTKDCTWHCVHTLG